jgi:hypothetical protein
LSICRCRPLSLVASIGAVPHVYGIILISTTKYLSQETLWQRIYSGVVYPSSAEGAGRKKEGAAVGPVWNRRRRHGLLCADGNPVLLPPLQQGVGGLLIGQHFQADKNIDLLADHAEIVEFSGADTVLQAVNGEIAVKSGDLLPLYRRMIFYPGQG